MRNFGWEEGDGWNMRMLRMRMMLMIWRRIMGERSLVKWRRDRWSERWMWMEVMVKV